MPVTEKIFGNSIGAFVLYGKTADGDLVPILVDDDGYVLVKEAT